MRFNYLFFLFFLVISVQCSAQVIVKANDQHIHYMGRVAMTDSAVVLSWSANSVKINFNGTGIKAVLRDERSDNNYNVIVDDKVVNVFHPLQEKKEYILAEGLTAGKHTLELFKRTEWAMGKTWFYNFELPQGSKILSSTITL